MYRRPSYASVAAGAAGQNSRSGNSGSGSGAGGSSGGGGGSAGGAGRGGAGGETALIGLLGPSHSRAGTTTSSDDSDDTPDFIPSWIDSDARPVPLATSSSSSYYRTSAAAAAAAAAAASNTTIGPGYNMTHSTEQHSHHQGQHNQHTQNQHGSYSRPNQLAPFWRNSIERENNLAVFRRHTTMGGDGYAGLQERFIMPAYLLKSKYMKRLVAKRDAAEAQVRRQAEELKAAGPAIRPSRSSSSLNLTATSRRHSVATSTAGAAHRGLTYEVIEARPPDGAASLGGAGSGSNSDADVTPLPSYWQGSQLEVIVDGTGLRWSASHRNEGETLGSALTDRAIPVSTGLYYYEVHVDSLHKDGQLGFGLATANMSPHNIPGWEPRSWAWHSDDGKKYQSGHQTGGNYSRPWGKAEVVGCAVNFWERTIFFTRNGHKLDDAFKDLDRTDLTRLMPCIGMKAPGATVRVNFGQEAFQYNIHSEYDRCWQAARHQYTSIPQLSDRLKGPSRTDDDFVKELVAQFLRHGGYVETARSFIGEVQREHDALGTGWQVAGNAAEEEIDAAQRQQIRSAILTGDVEKAIRCTNDFYPQVLSNNPLIDFRLKCRRFLEMIRRTTSSSSDETNVAGDDDGVMSSSVSTIKKEKARTTLPGGSAMDLDEPSGRADDGGSSSGGESSGGSDDDDDDDENDNAGNNDMDIQDANNNNGSAIGTGNGVSASAGQSKSGAGGGGSLASSATDLSAALAEGRQLWEEYEHHPSKEVQDLMRPVMGVWAYDDPTKSSEVGYLFRQAERVQVAEELNGAILESMGKSSVAAVERIAQQTEVLVDELTDAGLPGAFLNLERDVFD